LEISDLENLPDISNIHYQSLFTKNQLVLS